MKSFKQLFVLTLVSSLFCISCSKDDANEPSNPILSASNITTTIDENPQNGDLIGTITSNPAGSTFTMASQTISNALSVNSTTGEISVNDRTKFDFETNPVLGATITVTNDSQTTTAVLALTLNDVDDIASFLSASRANYMTAASGDWVAITENEYNVLASSLNDVTKGGALDEFYDADVTISPTSAGNNGVTVANNNSETLPMGSYCFAFKYRTNSDAVTGTKVKMSSVSPMDGFEDLGGILPEHNMGENYFVLKGSNSTTTNTGYLSMYYTQPMSYKTLTISTSYFLGFGDVNSLPLTGNTESALFLYQGLASTQKQWD